MVWYDDPIMVTAVLLIVIVAAGTVVFAMRRFEKRPAETKDKKPDKQADLDKSFDYSNTPFKYSKSVQATEASSAKNELRMLDLEREILGDAIRKLYEAQAEGKITEMEREKLAGSYKERMNKIKESISRDEGIVALHELEGMQDDLMKLFSQRFTELTSKVEELRTRIDVKPIREIPIKLPTQTLQKEKELEDEEEKEISEVTEEKEKRPRTKKPSEEKQQVPKNEGERRLGEIYSKVNEALEKLGQMEAEA